MAKKITLTLTLKVMVTNLQRGGVMEMIVHLRGVAAIHLTLLTGGFMKYVLRFLSLSSTLGLNTKYYILCICI